MLDLGCGTGRSWTPAPIVLARLPALHRHGVDLDDASISEARRHTAAAGVADRVTFDVRNAAELVLSEPVAPAWRRVRHAVLVVYSKAPDEALADRHRLHAGERLGCAHRAALGRGMRLPFGTYTDVELLDTLEVVAHERYEDLLKKAGVLNQAFVDYRVDYRTERCCAQTPKASRWSMPALRPAPPAA